MNDGSEMAQGYLDLQQKWLSPARSYQTNERLTDFVNRASSKPAPT
jgi:hypothetical protein